MKKFAIFLPSLVTSQYFGGELTNHKETPIYEAQALMGFGVDTIPLTIYTGYELSDDA